MYAGNRRWKSTHDAFADISRAINMQLGHIRALEQDYIVEQSKRISKGLRKPSAQEAYKLRCIKYAIKNTRAMEKKYNREYPDNPTGLFEYAVENEPEFVASRKILTDYQIHLQRIREAQKRIRNTTVFYKDTPEAIAMEQKSPEEIAILKKEIMDRYERSKSGEAPRSIIDDITSDIMKTINSQRVPEIEEFTSPEEIPEIEDYGPAPNSTFDPDAPEPKPDFSKFKLAVKKGENSK